MSRFLQLHLLTFYPPSNPNRDDTGRPKTATVGGVARQRISSQSIKRAVRTSDAFKAALDGHLAARTQRIGEVLREHLLKGGMEQAPALKAARAIAEAFGKLDDKKHPGTALIAQLAFVSPEERAAALALADRALAGETLPASKPEMAAALLRRTDAAADIAMFGRMLADEPDYNREAAVQVAHAITTHRVTIEDDFYTAVDDLQRASDAEGAGAGFVGQLGFGSGVFYLYACVDRELLAANLGGDEGLAAAATAALVEALATATPGGKRASFAHGGRAHYLLAERGDAQPRTLAGAFVSPVTGDDLLRASIDRLTKARDDMDRAYGPCADASMGMDVAAGTGTLAAVVAFAAT